MAFFRTFLPFWVAALFPVAAMSAQAKLTAEQQKQAQSVYNEHQAMQIAIKVHSKCGGIDQLASTAAVITADMRKLTLVNMKALTDEQMIAARDAIQKQIDSEYCEAIRAKPAVKQSNERAVFYRDFYLYVWHQYMELAAIRVITGGGTRFGGKDQYGCAGYSYDQIRTIKPLTDAAAKTMKTKGQYQNARKQAEDVLKSCQTNNTGIKNSPAVRMLEAAMEKQAKLSG